MSTYYNSKRTKNLFNPQSEKSFKLSRSKIDLFLQCQRCFYLDRRLGVGRPPGFPFNLNSAVDALFKKEFDIHRVEETAHPLMEKYGIDAVPFQHEKMDVWRENFVGVQYLHEKSNFLVFGAVDDIWINPQGELIVVDYKSTSKNSEITLDADWQIAYKRQMEIYQWLLRQNGFKVSDTGYFVYANGRKDKAAFDGKLEFDVTVIAYTGSDKWVVKTLMEAKSLLVSEVIPPSADDCDYCSYRKSAGGVIIEQNKKYKEKKSDQSLF
ncbi:MAG: PD-(D/E)XK nuclease family protein [Patescibacteria group bacterium]|nr:PD-(D/E)XK nuclease family protein [Patescibacteria group bacterium]